MGSTPVQSIYKDIGNNIFIVMAYIISGKQMADKICQEIKEKVSLLKRPPTLVVILVGERPDSMTYVKAKQKKCLELGIISLLRKFPDDSST